MRNLLTSLMLTALATQPLLAKPRLTSEQQLQKRLEGLTPGKPVNCISLYPSSNSTTYKGAIVYVQGSTRYVNRFLNGCPFLNEDDGIVTRSFGSQLCRGDIVNVFTPGIPIQRGSCVMGEFTPYKKPKS
jgi:hypothetical protein